jgi:ornithine cyclodeaminase
MKPMYRILTDKDVEQGLPIENAISVIEATFRARAQGKLLAPPRFSVGTEDASMVFTAGSEMEHFHVMGFRVYDRFAIKSPDRRQLVVVYDNRTGALKGLVIGKLIGAIRTAAINAVAMKYMANPSVQCLGILGSGFQAQIHAQAASAVRGFERIRVYSPSERNRKNFAMDLEKKTDTPVEAMQTPEEVVRSSDALICATKSPFPVFEAEWLKDGVHINTIGPRYKAANEVPLEAAERSQIIVTDSKEQAVRYNQPFFLEKTPQWARMVELSDVVSGKHPGRTSNKDITLFCSVGLAGTEVVVANEVLRLVEKKGNSE